MTPGVQERKRRPLYTLMMLVLLAAGVAAAIWFLEYTGPVAPREPVLTAEAKSYTRNLPLDHVEMKATDNALGQTLVEIVGDISNSGDRPLKSVVLTCLFYDINGIEILREPVSIVRERDGVFQPGETRRFRLPFDSIPDGWNQVMPKLYIAEIIFA